MQAQLGHLSGQPLAQKLVFAHGKAVACRQGLHMGGCVKKLHLQGLCGQTPQKPEKTGFAPDQKGFRKTRFFCCIATNNT